MSFLANIQQRQQAAAASSEQISNEDMPFVTDDMAPATPAPETAAPSDDDVVVITPEDEAVSPDADIEEGAAVEALLNLEASAESFGWSAGLLDFASREGLLAGTALESASFENYSMEADGDEVGGEVSKSIGERVKSWTVGILGKVKGLWEHVSSKFSKNIEETDAAASGAVDEASEKKAIPYAKIVGVVAAIAAAGAAIYAAVRFVNFKALSAPGAIEKATTAIDDQLRKVLEKIPGKAERALKRGGSMQPVEGKVIKRFKYFNMNEHRAALNAVRAEKIAIRDGQWTAAAVKKVATGLSSTKNAIEGAVKGLYNAAKNPGAVAESIVTTPKAEVAHKVTTAAVLAFVGSVVAVVSGLLYHVVLAGSNLVAGTVRSVTSRGPEAEA